ncbi:MAG: hypothetical protein BJ554DRAFT_2841 [Olpidium bornovanus]|uniref:Uncharacterized protein n=1 Tax=Olpidium bornovanus TaxID=278681 RepID=A0A8H8DLH4_9FUNG|nr:MAG: hypothetical protein BJ554DRAFT_2841 [Olpidium bornovanus]
MAEGGVDACRDDDGRFCALDEVWDRKRLAEVRRWWNDPALLVDVEPDSAAGTSCTHPVLPDGPVSCERAKPAGCRTRKRTSAMKTTTFAPVRIFMMSVWLTPGTLLNIERLPSNRAPSDDSHMHKQASRAHLEPTDRINSSDAAHSAPKSSAAGALSRSEEKQPVAEGAKKHTAPSLAVAPTIPSVQETASRRAGGSRKEEPARSPFPTSVASSSSPSGITEIEPLPAQKAASTAFGEHAAGQPSALRGDRPRAKATAGAPDDRGEQPEKADLLQNKVPRKPVDAAAPAANLIVTASEDAALLPRPTNSLPAERTERSARWPPVGKARANAGLSSKVDETVARESQTQHAVAREAALRQRKAEGGRKPPIAVDVSSVVAPEAQERLFGEEVRHSGKGGPTGAGATPREGMGPESGRARPRTETAEAGDSLEDGDPRRPEERERGGNEDGNGGDGTWDGPKTMEQLVAMVSNRLHSLLPPPVYPSLPLATLPGHPFAAAQVTRSSASEADRARADAAKSRAAEAENIKKVAQTAAFGRVLDADDESALFSPAYVNSREGRAALEKYRKAVESAEKDLAAAAAAAAK